MVIHLFVNSDFGQILISYFLRKLLPRENFSLSFNSLKSLWQIALINLQKPLLVLKMTKIRTLACSLVWPSCFIYLKTFTLIELSRPPFNFSSLLGGEECLTFECLGISQLYSQKTFKRHLILRMNLNSKGLASRAWGFGVKRFRK